MNDTHTDTERERIIEKQNDRSWYPIYAAVIVFAVLVISLLWAFSRFFSS